MQTSAVSAITNFYRTFGQPYGDAKLKDLVETAVDELSEQVQKRRGKATHDNSEALVYWDQEPIFNCFCVSLRTTEMFFFTFDISENSTFASKAVSFVIMLAVVVSIVTFVLSSLPGLSDSVVRSLVYIDIVCVCIFTLDYLVRLFTVPHTRAELVDRSFLDDLLSGRSHRILLTPRQRLFQFVTSPMGLVDFISVFPFWIEFATEGFNGLLSNTEGGSEVLRVMRLARIVRVFKLGKATEADLGEDRNMVLHLFAEVVKKAKVALQLVGLLIVLALLVFGSLIWYTERGVYFRQADPRCPHQDLCASGPVLVRQLPDGTFEDSPSPFAHIPLSFWWVLVTITTVGYGDYFPVTWAGYLIGAACILYGAVVFALPVGIIGTAFSQAYESFMAEQAYRNSLDNAENSDELGVISTSSSIYGSMKSVDSMMDAPAIFVELKASLHQVAMSVCLPEGLRKELEHKLSEVLKFEKLGQEHPVDALEAWGDSVLHTLKLHVEHAEAAEVARRCFARFRMAWYSVLFHTAVAEDQLQANPTDKHAFHLTLRAKDSEIMDMMAKRERRASKTGAGPKEDGGTNCSEGSALSGPSPSSNALARVSSSALATAGGSPKHKQVRHETDFKNSL